MLLSHKRERNNAAFSEHDDSEISCMTGSQRKTSIVSCHLYVKSKCNINELIYINRISDIESKLTVTQGKGRERAKLGVSD